MTMRNFTYQNPCLALLLFLSCLLWTALAAAAPSVPLVPMPATPTVSTVPEPRPVQPAGAAASVGVSPAPSAPADRAVHGERDIPREESSSAALSAREQELLRRGIARVEVRPARPYMLSLPFAGMLVSVEVRNGELVEKDQVLAVLDKQAMERELEEARLALAAAVEQVEAVREFAPREQEGARGNLARRADMLREAEERLAMTSLKAPFAGRVTEIRAGAGQHLRRGEVVMELAEHGDLEVISQVPSTWVSRLQPGNIIWVFVEETGKSYEAEFVRFGGRVSTATRSIRAYSRFVNTPAELLPGMGGRADFFPPQPR